MSVDIDVLKSKYPLEYLPDDTLEALAEIAVTTEHNLGDVLFNIGDNDDTTVFLIQGAVFLEACDGRTCSINQNNDSAKFGLATLKPRKYTARAIQNGTCLLRIKSEMLEHFSFAWNRYPPLPV